MSRRPEREADRENPFGQVWDSPNVSVIDGAVFVANPDKNPTLTLVALAMRACDKILDEGPDVAATCANACFTSRRGPPRSACPR